MDMEMKGFKRVPVNAAYVVYEVRHGDRSFVVRTLKKATSIKRTLPGHARAYKRIGFHDQGQQLFCSNGRSYSVDAINANELKDIDEVLSFFGCAGVGSPPLSAS